MSTSRFRPLLLVVSVTLTLAVIVLLHYSGIHWRSQVSTCGNGITDPGESCDDGNVNNRDGCSTGCQILSGWSCTGSVSVCHQQCGNSIVTREFGEECDDANTQDGDGCSRFCVIEKGWTCDSTTGHCRCATTARECGLAACGDGKLDRGEECDEGIANGNLGNGCMSNCSIVDGYSCTGAINGISVCSRDINVVLEEQRTLKKGLQ